MCANTLTEYLDAAVNQGLLVEDKQNLENLPPCGNIGIPEELTGDNSAEIREHEADTSVCIYCVVPCSSGSETYACENINDKAFDNDLEIKAEGDDLTLKLTMPSNDANTVTVEIRHRPSDSNIPENRKVLVFNAPCGEGEAISCRDNSYLVNSCDFNTETPCIEIKLTPA